MPTKPVVTQLLLKRRPDVVFPHGKTMRALKGAK